MTGTGGNDAVTVQENSSVQGDTKIALGDGTNNVQVNTATFVGNLTITTGSGDDTIHLTGETVNGTTNIDADGGTNTVTQAGRRCPEPYEANDRAPDAAAASDRDGRGDARRTAPLGRAPRNFA